MRSAGVVVFIAAGSGMLTLVLVVFALANLGLELGADVVEQLVQAGRAVPSGWDAPHASVRIHGHDCDTSIVCAAIDDV